MPDTLSSVSLRRARQPSFPNDLREIGRKVGAGKTLANMPVLRSGTREPRSADTWTSSTIARPPAKRAVALALVNAFGQ
jgi:hypothetical protein